MIYSKINVNIIRAKAKEALENKMNTIQLEQKTGAKMTEDEIFETLTTVASVFAFEVIKDPDEAGKAAEEIASEMMEGMNVCA